MSKQQKEVKILENDRRLNEVVIDNVRKDETIAALQQVIEEYKENIALLKRNLAAQALLFTNFFDYVQDLQQEMQGTVQVPEIEPS